MNTRTNKILAEIRNNSKKLSSCERHKFTGERMPPRNTHKCIKCEGEMKGGEVLWYITGYEAAGGDANDIFPNWHGEITKALK